MDKTGLSTGYRIMGDGIVYEKMFLIQVFSGDESDIFEDGELKK